MVGYQWLKDFKQYCILRNISFCVLDKASAIKPQQSSEGLSSASPTYEDIEAQSADASDIYGALIHRSAADQESQLYCELHSYDKQSVKKSPAKLKVEIKDRVYANVAQL